MDAQQTGNLNPAMGAASTNASLNRLDSPQEHKGSLFHVQRSVEIRWMIPSVRVQTESGAGFYIEKEEAKAVLLTALAQADNFEGISAQDCLEKALARTIQAGGLDVTKEHFLEQLAAPEKTH